MAVTAHPVVRELAPDLVERIRVRRLGVFRPLLVYALHESLGSVLARRHRVRVSHEPHERNERIPRRRSEQRGAGHLIVRQHGGVLDVLQVRVGRLCLHVDVLLLVVGDWGFLIVRRDGDELVLRVQRLVHPVHHHLRVRVWRDLLELFAVPRLVLLGELSALAEEHGWVAADVEVRTEVPVRDAVHGHDGDVRLRSLVPLRGVGPVLTLIVERGDALVGGPEVLAVRAPRREELHEAVLIRLGHRDSIVKVLLGEVDCGRRDRIRRGAFRREGRD